MADEVLAAVVGDEALGALRLEEADVVEDVFEGVETDGAWSTIIGDSTPKALLQRLRRGILLGWGDPAHRRWGSTAYWGS